MTVDPWASYVINLDANTVRMSNAQAGWIMTAYAIAYLASPVTVALTGRVERRVLLATGLGLLAAIPAVVFYNKLSADSDRIVAGYEAFADEFATILSRQLDS